MKRKVLQDHANTFCQMFIGWRMTANDLPRLLALGSAKLEIDVLTGRTTHEGQVIRSLVIAEELQAWFQRQLHAHSIPPAEIVSATLEVAFASSSRPARRGERHLLPVRCRSEIRLAGRSYVGELAEDVHVEHVRVT